MLFKITTANLEQIKDCVEQLGICFFHGDGNMYTTQEDSNFRKDFSNPKNEGAIYRVKFTSVSAVPDTVEGMTKLLFESRNTEVANAAKATEVSTTKVLTVKKPSLEESKLVVKPGSGTGEGLGLGTGLGTGGGAGSDADDANKVVKPYGQWNNADLIAELNKRGIEFTEGAIKKDMAALLDADDANKA